MRHFGSEAAIKHSPDALTGASTPRAFGEFERAISRLEASDRQDHKALAFVLRFHRLALEEGQAQTDIDRAIAKAGQHLDVAAQHPGHRGIMTGGTFSSSNFTDACKEVHELILAEKFDIARGRYLDLIATVVGAPQHFDHGQVIDQGSAQRTPSTSDGRGFDYHGFD